MTDRNTGFYKGRLGIGLLDSTNYGDGAGNPLYPLEIDGDIRLTGAIIGILVLVNRTQHMLWMFQGL
jgi:hypothetical protein